MGRINMETKYDCRILPSKFAIHEAERMIARLDREHKVLQSKVDTRQRQVNELLARQKEVARIKAAYQTILFDKLPQDSTINTTNELAKMVPVNLSAPQEASKPTVDKRKQTI